jgi:FAD/FMN-containing dehydrogenase
MPVDKQRATAMVSLPSMEKALELFQAAEEASFGFISAFELISHQGLEFVLRHYDRARSPFNEASPYYVLIESAAAEALEHLLTREEAVIARSEAQAQSLWLLRENLSEVQKKEGASIKHDISVPLGAWASFTKAALAAIEKAVAGTRPVIFGHIGDGNLHFNLSCPIQMRDEEFLSHRASLNKIVYGLVLEHQGSISAEHGIGILKQEELIEQKGEVALAQMRAIKKALDPKHILNPNKIFQLK